MRTVAALLATLALTDLSSAQLPVWLQGEWTREWIQTGSTKANTLEIHYLQTPTYFADIRMNP